MAKIKRYLHCPASHIFLKAKLQLPEEIEPHLTHAFRLIPKDLADQLPKRLGVPNVRLHKQNGKPSVTAPLYMKNGSYPIGFEILLLNVPDLGEPSRERRTDLGHDIFRCQRASDVFQRGRFQFRDLQSYVKRNSGPDLVLASIMK